MVYLTTTLINNKIARINSISQRTPMIGEYSTSVTDSVNVF